VRYLLDTDVLSDLMRRAAVAERVAPARRHARRRPGDLERRPRRVVLRCAPPRRASRSARPANRGDAHAESRRAPFDAPAARAYGELRATLERAGTPLGDADLRIASIALARSLVVVTGNARHFARVPGLDVENWFVDA